MENGVSREFKQANLATRLIRAANSNTFVHLDLNVKSDETKKFKKIFHKILECSRNLFQQQQKIQCLP